MNELIEKVKQWGVDRDIIGPLGKATPKSQAKKNLEEAGEIIDAIAAWKHADEFRDQDPDDFREDVIKEIGDNIVTLIMLCDMFETTPEYCLGVAYAKISKRTGTMVGGQFVKDN